MTEPLMVKENWAIHHNLEQVEANTYHDWCFKWLATGWCKKYECGWSPYEIDYPFRWLNDHQTVWRLKDRRIKDLSARDRVIVCEPYFPYEDAVHKLQPWTQIFDITIRQQSWHGGGATRIEIRNIPDDALNANQKLLIHNTFRWRGKTPPAGPYFDTHGAVRLRRDRRTKVAEEEQRKQEIMFYNKHGRFPLPGDIIETEDPLASGYLQPQASQEIQDEYDSEVFQSELLSNFRFDRENENSRIDPNNPFASAAGLLESPGDENL